LTLLTALGGIARNVVEVCALGYARKMRFARGLIVLGCCLSGMVILPRASADRLPAKPAEVTTPPPTTAKSVATVTPQTKKLVAKSTLTLTADERNSLKRALRTSSALYVVDKDVTKMTRVPAGMSRNAGRAYAMEAASYVARQKRRPLTKATTTTPKLETRYVVESVWIVGWTQTSWPASDDNFAGCYANAVFEFNYKNLGPGTPTSDHDPNIDATTAYLLGSYPTTLARLAPNATATTNSTPIRIDLDNHTCASSGDWLFTITGGNKYLFSYTNFVASWVEYTSPPSQQDDKDWWDYL
jgi:hypothetical protein